MGNQIHILQHCFDDKKMQSQLLWDLAHNDRLSSSSLLLQLNKERINDIPVGLLEGGIVLKAELLCPIKKIERKFMFCIFSLNP